MTTIIKLFFLSFYLFRTFIQLEGIGRTNCDFVRMYIISHIISHALFFFSFFASMNLKNQNLVMM